MKLPLNNEFGDARNGASTLETGAPCEAVWDLLSVYADKETSEHETAMVETHIAVCADCARDLQFMLQTSATFSTLPEIEPPAELRLAILAGTTRKPSIGRVISDMIQRFLAPAPARYGFAAAAGMAGILVAVGIHQGLPPAGGIAENPAAYEPKAYATAPPAPSRILKDPVIGPAPFIVKPPLPSVAANDAARRAPLVVRDRGTASPAPFEPAKLLTTDRGGSAAPKVVVPSPRLAVSGGEMKIKPLIVERQPDPMDEGTVTTADMVVMADPKPTNPDPKPMDPGTKETVVAAPPSPMPPVRTRFTLTSSSTSETVGQAASLADLKRALRKRDTDAQKALEQSLKAREIRLPVLRKTF